METLIEVADTLKKTIARMLAADIKTVRRVLSSSAAIIQRWKKSTNKPTSVNLKTGSTH